MMKCGQLMNCYGDKNCKITEECDKDGKKVIKVIVKDKDNDNDNDEELK
jgi:hypothetical protein